MFGLKINKEVTVRLTIVCNGSAMTLPASSVKHAKLLANTIADSMLLYDNIDHNYHYIEVLDGEEWVEMADEEDEE